MKKLQSLGRTPKYSPSSVIIAGFPVSIPNPGFQMFLGNKLVGPRRICGAPLHDKSYQRSGVAQEGSHILCVKQTEAEHESSTEY